MFKCIVYQSINHCIVYKLENENEKTLHHAPNMKNLI